MDPADFNFELPPELIAQQPLPERTASRLLELGPDGGLVDRHFADLPGLLRAGDLLVVNDSRVLPARLHGAKASGGRVEMLLERVLSPDEALVHPRRNLLMRAIDAVHPAEPDVSVREARTGDRYLVCSDGLSGYVSDERIHDLLGLSDPVAVVTALVDAALAAGAPDNVTCVIADVVQVDEAQPAQAPVVVGAAGEPRNRDQLPEYSFPADEQLDPHTAHVVKVRTASGNGASDVDAIADVYHEEQPQSRHRRRTGVIAVVVVLALVVAGLSALTWAWARNQFYVGSEGGYVAIYRGLPGSVGPLALHTVEQTTAITVDSLPDFEAMQVEGTIPTDSLASAEQVVQRLSERAAQCVEAPTTPGCPQTTGTDAGALDTATPSATASPSASGP